MNLTMQSHAGRRAALLEAEVERSEYAGLVHDGVDREPTYDLITGAYAAAPIDAGALS